MRPDVTRPRTLAMRPTRSAAAALIAALGLVASAAASDQATHDPARRARALLAQEADLLDALDGLDRRIAAIVVDQDAVRGARDARAADVQQTERDLTAARARLGAARERLERRLRARARLDDQAWRRVLFTAATPTDFLLRRGVLRAVLRADLVLIQRVRAEEEALAELQVERTRAVLALEAAEDELINQRQVLEDERGVRAALLQAVRGERRLAERLAAARARRLDAVPIAIDPAQPSAGTFAALRGQLQPPVPGRVLVAFGRRAHTELGTTTRSTGVTLDAPYGAPVRAVHGGRVVYSGWYKGFGNLVIIDHGDDIHTLYGHLSAIRRARGEIVASGTAVGEVGDAGSLRGPQLYFELRIKRKPVNPRGWVRGW